jgi:hypothetical protein
MSRGARKTHDIAEQQAIVILLDTGRGETGNIRPWFYSHSHGQWSVIDGS